MRDNIFKRDLPKPVVYGFFGLLALVVVVQLVSFGIRKQREKAEQEQQAIEAFEKRQENAELSVLRSQVLQDRISANVEGPGGGTIRQAQLIDPVLDDPATAKQIDLPTLKRYVEVDRTLLTRQNQAGWSLTHAAVYAERDDLLQACIEMGGKIDHIDSNGNSPLHLLVRLWPEGDQEALLDRAKILLEADADPNQASPRGITPTSLAFRLPDHRLYQLLLSHGGEPQQPILPGLPQPTER